MKNLMLALLLLALGFTTYSQNGTSLLHEHAKTVTLLETIIQKQSGTTTLVLKQSHLKCDLKAVNIKKTQIENSSIAGFKLQFKDFFRKFYGHIVLRLT